MFKYIGKRILLTIPIFIGITILVYYIATLAPGTPLSMLLQDPYVTQETIDEVTARYGLDQPVIIQYLRWLGNCLKGNLGYSYRTAEPVLKMVAERMGPTLLLTLSATIIALVVSIPLGLLAAYKPYSVWDYCSAGLSFLGAASPNFFMALIVIYLFAIKLGILPTGGMYSNAGGRQMSDCLTHLILPSCVLSLQMLGVFIRQTRSSMLEVLNDDYIRTARAKGLREKSVVFIHAFRNSLIPIVTQLGTMLPLLVGGAVIIEQVFSWPGLGSLMVLSINARDYPAIMGVTVVIAGTVLLGNIIVDIVYGILDPRIRYR
ncbi:ABC transporter permease [Roseburia hominis]